MIGAHISVIGILVTVTIFLWQEFGPKRTNKRPSIVVAHVTSPGGIEAGVPLRVVVTIENASAVPARNVRAASIAEWLPPNAHPAFSYEKVRITGNAVIGAGKDFLVYLYPIKDATGEIGYLTTEDLNKIISKSLVLFVHGHVSYEDDSGKSHWTNFCYSLSVRRTGEYYWNACSQHNDIDKT